MLQLKEVQQKPKEVDILEAPQTFSIYFFRMPIFYCSDTVYKFLSNWIIGLFLSVTEVL